MTLQTDQAGQASFALYLGIAVSARKWRERIYNSEQSNEQCEIFIADKLNGECTVKLLNVDFPVRKGSNMLVIFDRRVPGVSRLVYIENLDLGSVYSCLIESTPEPRWSLWSGFMWGMLVAIIFLIAAWIGILGHFIQDNAAGFFWAVFFLSWIALNAFINEPSPSPAKDNPRAADELVKIAATRGVRLICNGKIERMK